MKDGIIILPKEEKIKKGTFLCSSSVVVGKHIGGKPYDGILFSVSKN